jgi:protein tyrosine/serine phosphatase
MLMPDRQDNELFAQADPTVPIRNFRRVNDWFFRGGQPNAEGIEALAKLKVGTVVNLRRGRPSVEAERQAVEAAGITFVNIALNYWFLPTEETIAQFLRILDDETNRPIFVHCLHGKDRTGLLVAMYRVARQGWPVELAYKEMKLCGFHRFRVRNFKWLLWRFARKYKQSAG